MSESLPALNQAIVDAIADAGHDGPDAAEAVFACLIAGTGLLIAFRAAGQPDLADMLCETASVQIIETATMQARVLADARGG